MPDFSYLYYKVNCTRACGNVLNVGLGWGYSANWLIDNTRVNRVISIERDQQVIDDYNANFNPNLKHLIINGDARLWTTLIKFDWIYIDVLDGNAQTDYDNMKDIIRKVKNFLQTDGRISIEYLMDHSIEREFRRWILTELDYDGTELVYGPTGSKKGSGHIIYYKRKA